MEVQNFDLRNDQQLEVNLPFVFLLDWKVSSGPRTWQMFWGDLEMNWAIMEIYCRLNVHHICAS